MSARPHKQEVERFAGEGEPSLVRTVVQHLDWHVAAISVAFLGLMLVLLVGARAIAPALVILLAAIAIAEAMAPLVDRLERWLPRAAATILLYLVAFLFFAGIAWVVVPPVINQVQEVVDRVPGWIDTIQQWTDRWVPMDEGQVVDFLGTQFGNLTGTIATLPLALLSSGFDVALIVVVSIYWVLAMPKLLDFTLSLFPEEQREKAEAVLGEMGQTMGGYVRATLIVATIIGFIAYIGLSLIGFEYAVVVALIAGVFEIIPILGPFLAGIVAVGIALLDSPNQALTVLAFWVVLQAFESYILTPQMMHRRADIPPLLVLLALFAGASAGGVLTALVAIPVAGALRVFVLQVVAPAVRRWWGAPEPEEEAA